MGEKKDYYKILGTTKEEIDSLKSDAEREKFLKGLYRKKAVADHPDHHPEETKKYEEIFKDDAEAYATLSDPNKRAQYDNPASNFSFDGSGIDINDILRNFGMGGNPFDGFFNGGFGNFGNATRRVVKGSDLMAKISYTLEEAYNGGNKKISYNHYVKCDECGGTGKTDKSEDKICDVCGGTGQEIKMQQGGMTMFGTCHKCHGTGHIVSHPCGKCNGQGIYVKKEEVSIDVPKGVMNGMQMKIEGMGNAIANGINGDLIIQFLEAPNKTFERNGNDLYFDVNVPILDALLGGKKEVKTIGGKKLSVTIRNGVEDGTNIKMNGYGMPLYGNDGQYGNLIGIIHLVLPKKLNEKEKKTLETLRHGENFT
jgi:molecular chaperone DnaJ